MRTLALIPGLFLAACTVGSTDPIVGGGGDDGPGDPSDGMISGAITENQTWTEAIELVGEATIMPGVTVTVDPGTSITAKDGVTLRVQGSLEIAGTADATVSLEPATGATTWAG